MYTCGGISGGLNPSTSEASRHAKEMYASIRKRTTDCLKIAENTGYPIEVISLIKGYVFYCQHCCTDGFTQFFPSYEIAESWRRLTQGKSHILPHDLLLLKHELREILFITEGYSQSEAHIKASQLYDYHGASDAFYATQKFRQPNKY